METQIMLCAGCLLNFLLFSDDKATLWAWKNAIEARLADLRLTMHPHAGPHPVQEGIPVLGFVVYPQRRRLQRAKGVRYRRRWQQLLAQYERGTISMEQLTASVQGWINHTRYGNTVGLRKAVITRALVPPQRKRL